MNEAMTHERCSELLPGILRGDLTSEDEGAARAHLAECEGCRAELAGLRSLHSSQPPEMNSEERDALHRGVAAALARQVRGAGDVIPLEGKRRAPRGARWLGAAAAVLVLAVGATFVLMQFFGSGGGAGDAALEGADSGGGGDEGAASAPDFDGPRPVFAGTAFALSDAPEEAAEESGDQATARSAEQFSKAIDSADRLRRLARGSPLLAAFAGAYDASDAEALADTFLGLLVEDAGNSAAAQVEECGQATLDASIDPILPVFAAPTRYEGEKALVLGYVTGDPSLEDYSVWVWPEGSCDRPLHAGRGHLQ